MITFKIEEINNGFLIKGEYDWTAYSKSMYFEDFTLFAATLPDAFATIATKCDNLMDEVIEAAEFHKADTGDITEELPF